MITKNEIEPRMNTDEIRINNSLPGECTTPFVISPDSHIAHGLICVDQCSSVANMGS